MTTQVSETATPFRAGNVDAVQPLIATGFADPHVLLADISEFQPNVVDAAYLAWSKAIVIRCAYGSNHQDQAWYGGQRRQLLHQGGAKFVGIYQYLVAGQNPAAQAQAMKNIVGKLQPGEVLIADAEEGNHALLTMWYDEVLALGYDPKYLWTYSGLNFATDNGMLPVQWLAAYQNNEPSSPHKLWQFTSSYSIPGVGVADCSVFHGTIDQLAALATPVATPSAPPAKQTGVVTSYTTGGKANVTSSDGGHTLVFGGSVPAGAIPWQVGEWTSDQTKGTAYVATNNGGGIWHFAGTKPS